MGLCGLLCGVSGILMGLHLLLPKSLVSSFWDVYGLLVGLAKLI